MPFQGLPWTEFISCPVCFKLFNEQQLRPISLACGHTVCKSCIKNRLHDNKCPFDQIVLPNDVDKLPANFALMHLVGAAVPEQEKEATKTVSDNPKSYEQARKCVEEMAVHLKPLAEKITPSADTSDDDSSSCSDASPNKGNNHSLSGSSSHNSNGNINSISNNNGLTKCVLSRPMQRKLISLIHCQLLEEEGRSRAARIARSLGERIVSELLVLHQYPHQLSANLWAAVRTRGCQFLGPAMQEEVLKLILLALEDGSFLSRKVLVLFVVQRLESRYPQASKTAIGHVVQLLYRASCFKVLKREEESSLMQLKEEFRQYESLRREHDSQIVQIAMEAGLRISPEQWSSLLYGDPAHKSHMQSIIDKHQSPQSFAQSISELMLSLQRSGDHSGLQKLQPQLEFLSNIDPSPDCAAPSWENLEAIMRSLNTVMSSFVEFLSNPDHRSRLETAPIQNTRYKTSMCRDFSARGTCPRGNTCTFAHSQEELERYRSRSRRNGGRGMVGVPEKTSSSLTPSESDQLRQVQLMSKLKVEAVVNGAVQGLTGMDKHQSVVELLDPKLAAGSPVHELSPLLNKLALAQAGMPTLLQQQRGQLGQRPLVGIGAANLLDPEKAPFIPSAGAQLSSARLAYARPGVEGLDALSHSALGTQVCFHPQSPNAYGHQPHLSGLGLHSSYHTTAAAAVVPGFLANSGSPLSPGIPQGSCLGRAPHSLSPTSPTLHSPVSRQPVTDMAMTQINVAGLASLQSMQSAEPITVEGSDLALRHALPPGSLVMTTPLQGGDSLEELTSRKQEIISHLQEEQMFMDPDLPIFHGGDGSNGKMGFAGLKSVLGNNKRTREPMPKLVSDMFVATRSTQSLDELRECCSVLNDDMNPYISKWSSGDELHSDLPARPADLRPPGVYPTTGSSTTTAPMSMASVTSTTAGGYEMFQSNGSYGSFDSGIGSSSDASLSTLSSGNESEFSSVRHSQYLLLQEERDVFHSFPDDDTDENFIPFDQTCAPRFGPISRMSRVKMNDSEPVQVTADSCKRLTPVLSVTPLERPLTSTAQVPSRFVRGANLEPSVRSTPMEIPSIWQHSPHPSYQNIARLKAGAAEAATNNERLAYELQAIELEISMKTGKKPEPVGKIIQDAVKGSYLNNSGHAGLNSSSLDGDFVLGRGHVTECLSGLTTGNNTVSSQKAAQRVMEEYYRSWQGVKK